MEHFFRHESGRLAAVLTRRFGAQHLETVEDAIQHALERALGTWNRNGIPEEPSAWLTRVASNYVLDQIRRVRVAESNRHAPVETPRTNLEDANEDAPVLLFDCADERLAPHRPPTLTGAAGDGSSGPPNGATPTVAIGCASERLWQPERMVARLHRLSSLPVLLFIGSSCQGGDSSPLPETTGGASSGSSSGGAAATGGSSAASGGAPLSGGTSSGGTFSVGGSGVGGEPISAGGQGAGGVDSTGGVGASGSGGSGGGSACELSDATASPGPVDLVVPVDPTTMHQTSEGWGTSLCWFGNVVGGWSDEKRAQVADRLFDAETGLGLNVVRYNIGGGDAPGHDHMGLGKEMPGVKASETSAYDYAADARQIQMLMDAVERIAPTELLVEGFANSPPWWMTESGCTSGGNNGASNLKADYYDDFADFLADVTLHFRDELGIAFRTVEPLNEPVADWWSAEGAQEGCHFSRSEQAVLLVQLRESLDHNGLTEVQIAAPDESSLDETLESYQSYDAATRGVIDQINTHAYAGSRRAELRQLATSEDKRLWSSEIDGSGAAQPFDVFPHDHDDIVPGLDLAQRITRDLREMQVDAFVFWQAVESEAAQLSLNKNWGLLHGDFATSEETWLTKKYHVMRQYTRFIRPGDVMIDIGDDDAVAFMNEAEGKVVIVQRNAQMESTTRSYDLGGFAAIGATARVFRTSSSEDHLELEPALIRGGALVTTIAPRSVTTFVLECASLR